MLPVQQGYVITFDLVKGEKIDLVSYPELAVVLVCGFACPHKNEHFNAPVLVNKIRPSCSWRLLEHSSWVHNLLRVLSAV